MWCKVETPQFSLVWSNQGLTVGKRLSQSNKSRIEKTMMALISSFDFPKGLTKRNPNNSKTRSLKIKWSNIDKSLVCLNAHLRKILVLVLMLVCRSSCKKNNSKLNKISRKKQLCTNACTMISYSLQGRIPSKEMN